MPRGEVTAVGGHPHIAQHLLEEAEIEAPTQPPAGPPAKQPAQTARDEQDDEDIGSASADEVFALLDRELGSE